ncbi:hypothetical protein NPX13_g8252 [Xylaria arbuscula]|uniref:Cupin type-1 domain-containing protein n=1 Tax=Xylaria arbuscula TaxID=114810 RepID=A0A9W8TKC4_9PEZI|nr:hypothetical protein NPX13_g8252 [Xylaria arbuscula]
MTAVSIPSTFASFTETWSPRLIAAVNDQQVKIAKIDGSFIFHAHPDSDELFYLLAGELTLEIESESASNSEPTPKSAQSTETENADADVEVEVDVDVDVDGQPAQRKGIEAVVMRPGDVYVVPRGVRHRPVARNAQILMIERNDTVNTGDAADRRRQKDVVDARV